MLQNYRPIEERDFPEIEAYLQTSLTPVTPNSIFISGLRNRLINNQNLSQDVILSRQYKLVFFLGTVSLVFLIIAGIRAALIVLIAIKGYRNKKPRNELDEIVIV
jgi:hypothetical protein